MEYCFVLFDRINRKYYTAKGGTRSWAVKTGKPYKRIQDVKTAIKCMPSTLQARIMRSCEVLVYKRLPSTMVPISFVMNSKEGDVVELSEWQSAHVDVSDETLSAAIAEPLADFNNAE